MINTTSSKNQKRRYPRSWCNSKARTMPGNTKGQHTETTNHQMTPRPGRKRLFTIKPKIHSWSGSSTPQKTRKSKYWKIHTPHPQESGSHYLPPTRMLRKAVEIRSYISRAITLFYNQWWCLICSICKIKSFLPRNIVS